LRTDIFYGIRPAAAASHKFMIAALGTFKSHAAPVIDHSFLTGTAIFSFHSHV